MKIYFEHKESKTKLFMDVLQQNEGKIINVMPMTYAKMLYDGEIPILEDPITCKTYKANDIPFNKDWELKGIDDSFTRRELEILRQSLYHNNDITPDERYSISDKITEKMDNIRKMSCEMSC